jgi:hypothetical protein
METFGESDIAYYKDGDIRGRVFINSDIDYNKRSQDKI